MGAGRAGCKVLRLEQEVQEGVSSGLGGEKHCRMGWGWIDAQQVASVIPQFPSYYQTSLRCSWSPGHTSTAPASRTGPVHSSCSVNVVRQFVFLFNLLDYIVRGKSQAIFEGRGLRWGGPRYKAWSEAHRIKGRWSSVA